MEYVPHNIDVTVQFTWARCVEYSKQDVMLLSDNEAHNLVLILLYERKIWSGQSEILTYFVFNWFLTLVFENFDYI